MLAESNSSRPPMSAPSKADAAVSAATFALAARKNAG